MKNPIRHAFDFREGELPVIALLFGFSFCAMSTFQMLKAPQKAVWLKVFDAEAELNIKLVNIIVAALAVTVFTVLYNRLRRKHLVTVICSFFVIAFVAVSPALADPGTTTIWTFYLLVDLISTLLVATFWAYATDLFSADQAKRLFGVVGGGGITGGLVGAAITSQFGEKLGTSALLYLAAGFMIGIVVVTFATERAVQRSEFFRKPKLPEPERPVVSKAEEKKPNAAIEGARLVLRSPYLLAIVGIMACYEVASQTMDYQFSTMSKQIEDATARGQFLADVRLYANILSVSMQFFFVSLIMRKLGVMAALLVLPLAIAGSSVGFLVLGSIQAASLLSISDNGLNYSIQQTARESLYTVTTADEKYKARAFTNMFVQRFSKGFAILTSMALIQAEVLTRNFSLVAIVMAIGMMACGVYAGRIFAQKTRTEEKPARTILRPRPA